jgi:translation initiation factor 2B subunit (eIF-2B alpha/beta/delta family)
MAQLQDMKGASDHMEKVIDDMRTKSKQDQRRIAEASVPPFADRSIVRTSPSSSCSRR